jgi:hypothetical protein
VGERFSAEISIIYAPPPALIYGFFMGEQKLFPATKESYRVYIGTRYHAPTPIQIAARVTMFPKRIVGRLISEYMAREKNTVFFMHQLANR